MSQPPHDGAVERAWRTERARIVASLARRLGELDRAEDAAQDAFAAAVSRWPVEGVPDNPGAWLMTTAWRRALDGLRRERRRPRAELAGGLDGLAGPPDPPPDALRVGDETADEVLGLLLACCHPALAPEARVALTLRHVAGLTPGEIAAAFLVSGDAMAKRLFRARAKIREAGIPFGVPDRRALPSRLADARSVVYLVFTEGHLASSDGPPVRDDLCDEAVWLARQLHALVPGDPESVGLLALLLFLHARRPSRLDGSGDLVAPGDQDRSRWDAGLMDEARGLLGAAGGGPLGPYRVEAAIAALHVSAPDADSTPWPRIAELYAVLERLAPSPVVTVNRAVAVGRSAGAQAGLDALAPVLASGALDAYVPLHAAHADLLQRSGQSEAARSTWRRAAALAGSTAMGRGLLRAAEETL